MHLLVEERQNPPSGAKKTRRDTQKLVSLREDRKKLGNLLASTLGKLRPVAEHNDWAIHKQIQKVTSLEITSGPQLCFSSGPRKSAKPGGWHQVPLQWPKTPWKGTPGQMRNTVLKPSPASSPKIPTCKREIKASRQRTKLQFSLWGGPGLFPFSLLSPTSFSWTLRQWAAGSLSQANPLNLSPKPPFSITSQWARTAHLGSSVASPTLSLY